MENKKIEEKPTEEKKVEKKKEIEKKKDFPSCDDKRCPFHGKISLRGRTFKGYVIKKFDTRIVIEFKRVVYIRKYERYIKKKTKIHAHLPKCLFNKINLNDYIEVKECRPLSKIIHFIVTRKVKSIEEGKK